MYIDPAAGSLILQVVIAGALAVAASFRTARQAVKSAVQKLLGRRGDK